jgi:cell wall-associated NlpC family hydrolase
VIPLKINAKTGDPCQVSLTADFADRDSLPEAVVKQTDWYLKNWNNGWGPHAAAYPPVQLPSGCDATVWQRQRIIAVARKYIGLAYRHHHVPGWNPPASLTQSPNEGSGLDCSNFTAWVYNYGLGIRFTSEVRAQAEGPGRLLKSEEVFQPGDLLFIRKLDQSEVSHVVIYIDADYIIDSHDEGVQIRAFKGWYKTHLDRARRIIGA